MALLLIAGAALAFIAWAVATPLLARRRRERLSATPLPAVWEAILERRVAIWRRLPEAERERVRRHLQVFLFEKDFIGCAGQAIDDEVRVTIAAQACLLLPARGARYFPRLATILVYPGAFVVERLRMEPSGVLQENRQVLAGESWSRGQVVLSWQDVLEGAAVDDDGRNVVIHEFAHQLDQEKGHANGAPPRASARRSARWSEVMLREYERLRYESALGVPTLLSPYGATEPAEFFAVASEVFFEQSREMLERHPELYREFRDFYRADPASW